MKSTPAARSIMLIKSLMNKIVLTMKRAINAIGKKRTSQLRSKSETPVRKSIMPRMRTRIIVSLMRLKKVFKHMDQ